MSEQDGLNPAERELEEALRSLAPAAAHIDPIGAAFEAGRRSARRQVRLWQSATAAAILVVALASIVPIGGPVIVRARIEQAPIAAVNPSPVVARPVAAQSLFLLQAAMRDRGLAGLPPTQLPAVGSARPSDVL